MPRRWLRLTKFGCQMSRQAHRKLRRPKIFKAGVQGIRGHSGQLSSTSFSAFRGFYVFYYIFSLVRPSGANFCECSVSFRS